MILLSKKLIGVSIKAVSKRGDDGKLKYVTAFRQGESEILKETDKTISIGGKDRFIFNSRVLINKRELNQLQRYDFGEMTYYVWFIEGERDIKIVKDELKRRYEEDLEKLWSKARGLKESFETGDWSGRDE